jgi:C-terminal processing protease CtpA/Prc
VQKIRGKKGTQVILTIARQSSGIVDIIEKNVVRDTILIPSVSSKVFSGSSKGYNI